MISAVRRWGMGFAALALAFVAPAAVAHTKSETHSVWQIDGHRVHVEFSMPLLADAWSDLPPRAGPHARPADPAPESQLHTGRPPNQV